MNLPMQSLFLLSLFERSSSVSSHRNRNNEKDDFSVGDTNRLGNNIRVVLIVVEPRNDLVVTSPYASPLMYKRLVGAILHNARTKSRYVLMRDDRDVF